MLLKHCAEVREETGVVLVGSIINALLIALSLIVLVALVLVIAGVTSLGQLSDYVASAINSTSGMLLTSTVPPYEPTIGQGQNFTYNYSDAYLYNYTLGLINKDRANYSVPPVTLSSEPSGQQHADSMLENGYFSHWDIYGMKPYMRYTLVGGNGSVEENIAYRSSELCGVLGCRGNINVTSALAQMEYSMMYNDSAEHWLHRYNILNANHTGVSIGIAYNSSSVYLVEDFVDNYISWRGGTPGMQNGYVYLEGSVKNGYSLNNVLVSYDAPVANLTPAQLGMAPYNDGYSYGSVVAGVAQSSNEYYQNLTTIVATTYSVKGQSFDVAFNVSNLISEYHAGEYTIEMWLEPSGTSAAFLAATHTFFINSSGSQFTPTNV